LNAATGLANYMLPLRSGEALRLWWLARRGRQPAAAGLGFIVADHAFDLGGVTAVLAAGTVLKATGSSQLPALPALFGRPTSGPGCTGRNRRRRLARPEVGGVRTLAAGGSALLGRCGSPTQPGLLGRPRLHVWAAPGGDAGRLRGGRRPRRTCVRAALC